MKKTLTVNLGGIIFNIDEDAYQLLDSYLSNLRAHYGRELGSDEIMSDFEGRISELLNDRIRLGAKVITIEHVEDVISRMGKPEEIYGQEEPINSGGANSINSSAATSANEAPRKRLMRDPDNKVLGGVSSGLAHYFNIDITAMRLIMLLLLFFGNVPIVFIYIILWIAMPLAKTATDKLMMRGASVNIENIGKTVTDVFDQSEPAKPRTTIQKIGDFIVSFFGVLLKICAVLLAIVLLPVLLLVLFIFVIVMSLLIIAGGASLFGITSALGNLSFWLPNLPLGCNISTGTAIAGSASGFLFVGIPLAALCYLIGRKFFKFKPMSSAVKLTLTVLWIISLIVCLAISIYFGHIIF